MEVPEDAMYPEADGLLDAIWDNPGDDTPRLVYADWLQEHGYEDYSEFIRLAVLLARQVMPADERARLRQQRYRLGREIIKAYPESAPVIAECKPPDGIPREDFLMEASAFVKDWCGSWPFVRPRRLALWNLCGCETGLGGCEYLKRLVSLACEGTVTGNYGHWREAMGWQPVAGVLLTELVNNQYLQNLRALTVEPIVVAPSELLGFADSALAQQLDELQLWVQFPDGSREDLRGLGGVLTDQIQAFVAEHAARFAVQPA